MVIRINGQNPKKNVPPVVNRSLARGINPWNKQRWSIAFYDVSMPQTQSKRTLRFKSTLINQRTTTIIFNLLEKKQIYQPNIAYNFIKILIDYHLFISDVMKTTQPLIQG